MPRRVEAAAHKRSVKVALLLSGLELVFGTLAWATLPLRVIARILFARTRRMPMSMADEVNYLTPRVVRAVEGRHAEIVRTTSAQLFAESALTALRCAIGRVPHVVVPAALTGRRFPAQYLVPFHGQPNGYLSARSPVITERMQEVMYGEALQVMRREAARALGAGHKPGVILDLGAGAGTFLRTLRAEHYHARLFGVELSPYMIAAAYAHQLDGLDDHVEMIESNIANLPFETGSARGVTACFVLHELPEQQTKATLKEVARVLAPGGRFVVLDCSAPRGRLARISTRVRARVFFEPYRQDFLRLDLPAYLERLGLRCAQQEVMASDVTMLVFEKPEVTN